MAFTKAKITHTFENADGTPSSGRITFTLTKRITNGNQSITPSSVAVQLPANGQLSVELTSNVDSGTLPTDSQWKMEWHILGSDPEEFFITVPSGGGTVELATLLPTQPFGG